LGSGRALHGEDSNIVVDDPTPELFPVSIEGEYGYIHAGGAVVIPPLFGARGDFQDGIAQVWMWSGPPDHTGQPGAQHGVIDTSGEFVAPAQYDELRDYSEGLAAFLTGDVWGYLDQSGRVAITPRFSCAWRHTEGLAPVELDTRLRGMINTDGEIVFEVEADALGNCRDGRILCVQDDQHTYLDKDGNVALEIDCSAADSFSEGRAAVLIGDLTGYMDLKGELAITPKYLQAGNFHGGLAVVEIPNTPSGEEDCLSPQQWVYIDREGNRRLDRTFAYATDFSEGLAAVKLGEDDEYAYIDRNGSLAIPPRRCRFAEPFRGGLARVQHPKSLDRFGYIDRSGEWVWKW